MAGSVELTRCNGFNDPQVAWDAVASGSEEPMPLRGLVPPMLLPDGTEFKTWEQPAGHRRTFFVAQRHANASDDNPGTEERPWKTIGRAAALLEPGDRVLVKAGLYREWVRPARGGTGPKRMITYQAAPGENVILSGSDPLAGRWTASTLAEHTPLAKSWMIDLSASLFQGYHPFAESNMDPAMMKASWANPTWKKPPCSLPRGMVFQNGRRLTQVAQYEELAKEAGAYWVEPGEKRLHVRPLDDGRPEDASFEVTTRPFVFAPEKAGLGFVRVDGFTVEHVSNCVPVPQLGAISTMQGHHWIVENNLVREANGLGLDYGRRHTFIPYEVPADTPKLAGVGTIVRRNAFYACGSCSLSGLGLVGGLVESNYSQGCGWRRVGSLCESAGIKLHYLKHCLVRHNVVEGTIDAAGLWVDHSNTNSRITANTIVGAETSSFGGMFLEASYRPNLIDHNVIWGCRGHAFYQHDCGELIVTNNLFGGSTKLPVLMRKTSAKSPRMIDIETKRMSKSERNRVIGNVFYGFGPRGVDVPEGMDNVSDYNVYANPPEEKSFDLAAWQKRTGREMHSIVANARLEFSTSDWTLRGTLPVLEFPRIGAVTCDYFGASRAEATTEAGPWIRTHLTPAIELRIKGQ